MITYRTLDGDDSDEIPGVKGVGIKTIIKEFPKIQNEIFTIDDLLAETKKHVLNCSKKKVFQNIIDAIPQIELNFKLMQLDDVDISGEAKLKINKIINSKINGINRLQFRKLLIGDRLHFTIKDPDTWLSQGFNKIDINARK